MKTTKEAAIILGYANDAVIRMMIRNGRLKAKKFAHIWMIEDEELVKIKKK
jgi:hypothetical protein